MLGVQVVVGRELERSSDCGDGQDVVTHECLFEWRFELLWMGDEQFSNGLTDDIPDWLVVVVCLCEVEWHQLVDIVLETLWLINNNFSQS